MRVDAFDFDLPESCIALRPVEPRDAARMLHVGADGLLIEGHPCPREAWCDADQALAPDEFASLMVRLAAVAEATGRPLAPAQDDRALASG